MYKSAWSTGVQAIFVPEYGLQSLSMVTGRMTDSPEPLVKHRWGSEGGTDRPVTKWAMFGAMWPYPSTCPTTFQASSFWSMMQFVIEQSDKSWITPSSRREADKHHGHGKPCSPPADLRQRFSFPTRSLLCNDNVVLSRQLGEEFSVSKCGQGRAFSNLAFMGTALHLQIA